MIGALLGCGDTAVSPADQVDRAMYEADLRATAGTRSPGTPHWQEVQDRCADRFASLGFTVEPWAFSAHRDTEPVAFGTFVTVWRKQRDGGWKWVVDLGVAAPVKPQ